MKKILLFLFVTLLIIGGIFHQEIIATINFYTYQQDNPDIFNKATIDWKQVSFSSADYSTVNNEPLKIHSLQALPPFIIVNRQETEDFARATNNSKSISVSTAKEPEEFFEANNFSAKEKTFACKFLSRTSGLSACDSNYDLYRAFLELNKSDTHVFSSITEKDLYLKLLEIRAEDIASNKVSGFETKHTKGFMFIVDHQTYSAEIFDKNDQRYKLTFSGLEKAEVTFTLSNIYPNI